MNSDAVVGEGEIVPYFKLHEKYTMRLGVENPPSVGGYRLALGGVDYK